jgi:prepilin-type N-terminal cleavage/methylation domain-containing protein
MRIKSANRLGAWPGGAGFTLLEVVVSLGVIGVVFISLYAALASGVSVTQMSRENARATQILLEKAETFRLYDWDQITTDGWVPDKFTTSYCPTATNSAQGSIYSGTITISTPDLSTNYEDDMRQIDIILKWTTGSLKRSRTMTFYVARNGMQNYTF